MWLTDALLSALLNLVLLAGLPFLGYYVYHRWRHKRGLSEIARRAGLQGGNLRYFGYSTLFALAAVTVLLLWPLDVQPLVRQGSAFRQFVGLGLSLQAITMALLYGVVKTGLAEEILFRGLIAGSLGRRLPLWWANLLQALIFLLPHVPLVVLMPEAWPVLLPVFVGSLFLGWVRIKGDSILGPWLIHASANVATALLIAVRTAA